MLATLGSFLHSLAMFVLFAWACIGIMTVSGVIIFAIQKRWCQVDMESQSRHSAIMKGLTDLEHRHAALLAAHNTLTQSYASLSERLAGLERAQGVIPMAEYVEDPQPVAEKPKGGFRRRAA